MTLRIGIGDPVQVRAGPDVDQRLWHRLGMVSHIDEQKVIVELETGADCAFVPDQLEVLGLANPAIGPNELFLVY